MLISSDANGGQIVSSRDDPRFYDDVGCLAADWAAHSHPAEASAFVRTAGGPWIEARSASYARPEGAHTAMGSGLMAFATIAEARRADREGRVMTFDAIVDAAGAAK
jgi:hypothetical protein